METTKTGEQISGNYISAVGAQAGTPFALIGHQVEDLIAFSVNFGSTGALTAFAGQHTVERGTEKIITMWHLAANVADDKEAERLFAAVWAGSDTFVRNKPGHCP